MEVVKVVDEVVQFWGVKVLCYEVVDINLLVLIKDVMEKQVCVEWECCVVVVEFEGDW